MENGGIVPENEITVEEIKALRGRVVATLLEMVSKKANKRVDELVVRDILPLTDLGFAKEEWTNQTAQADVTWTKDWDEELDEDQAVAFYGIDIQDETSVLLFVRFKLGATGATTKGLYSIQRLLKSGQEESDKKQKGFFQPVFYGGKETAYVDYYARGTLNQFAGHPVLIGLFCEPKGDVVS